MSACDGATVCLDEDGLVQNECDEIDCPYFSEKMVKARKIDALWCAGSGDIPWTYKTDIPHAKFDVMEDDELFCIGIIFRLEDANAG